MFFQCIIYKKMYKISIIIEFKFNKNRRIRKNIHNYDRTLVIYNNIWYYFTLMSLKRVVFSLNLCILSFRIQIQCSFLSAETGKPK